MLTVYLHDGPESLRIQLIGELAGPDVVTVEGTWVTARSTARHRKVIFDLCGLRGADSVGRGFLKKVAATGAAFLTANAEGEWSVKTPSHLEVRGFRAPRPGAGELLQSWWARARRMGLQTGT